MKKTLIVALSLSLVAGALALPASAKKKKKAKPQQVTMFLHGTDPLGETEYATLGTFMKMDGEEPSASEPKSRFATNYVVGPNTECSGNALLPTWQGTLVGNVKGDVTVTLNTVGSPTAQLSVELYADGTGGCNSEALGATDYMPPVAETVADVPPGPGVTEVVFEDVNFKTLGSLVMMVHMEPVAADRTPHQVRLLYDAADFASKIELTCTPTSGKSCI